MALQDLTPQLRTRLSRVERMVGVFVTVASLLMVAGFAYYLYHTAQKKGWFLAKVRYQTGVNSAADLAPGTPVMLMGKEVGKVTKVEPNDPRDYYGLTVEFEVMEPAFGYIWTDSKVKVTSGLLEARTLEVTKGSEDWAAPTVGGNSRANYARIPKESFEKAWAEETKRLIDAELAKTGEASASSDRKEILKQQARYNLKAYAESSEGRTNLYVRLDEKHGGSPFWIDPLEAKPVAERVEEIVTTVEKALPSFLALTNQLTAILDNAASATAKLDALLSDVKPAAQNLSRASEDMPRLSANLAQITQNLTNAQGGLGEWVLTDDLKAQIEQTFGGVQSVMGTANTNLLTLNQSLENLSQITGELSTQVRANTNLLSGVYHLVIDADQLIQGLKQHWLLRSSFK